MSTLGLITQAVTEVAKVVGKWIESSERRRMKVALDSAERYIFVNEKGGEYNFNGNIIKSFLRLLFI